ncbi:ABC transporter permease [Edaphobacillus lindanitolerans]|uniref:Putative ABC transport system permease protein n=1 Tax=Edaphobacillus lindanitolerans TaxID=550447 RepID=A0A1U7PTB5_9BACI|nr:ABC transporter permease [Edaphobacillus lindanitolerans]SIT93002.1 putative ABC transport system permease protein [Edaphobacillus lindanitolerans]
MTLFDLALKNIRRNMKNYSLYIGSTVFSILIYFTFATLKYSGDIGGMAEASKQIQAVMGASAFVLMVFVAIFIVYSNSFFMKKRKKEVALYSLLGVRKKSIGFLLFFENMVIGLVSLIIGVVLGFLLSRGLLSILLKLMGMEVVAGFTFSMDALINTCLVFFVIFLFTSLLGYRIIYRFKLIDLFHAEKKGEEIPRVRVITAIAGVASLAAAYYIALQDVLESEVWRLLGIGTPLAVIALTVLGSYLLFDSVLVYVLSVLKRNPRWAWKGLNLMTASQLLYRIRGNAKTLTIITVLSATTITAGGAVFGVYYNAEKDVQKMTPYTFMWEGQKQDIDPAIVESQTSFNSKLLRLPYDETEMEYAVIDESTFDELAKNLEWTDIQKLHRDEVFAIDGFYDERWSDKLESVTINDTDYPVAHFYEQAPFNTGTLGSTAIVVPDELYGDIQSEEKLVQAVQVSDYKKRADLSDKLAAATDNFSSRTADYKAVVESSGALLFVGSFLGLVFLVATGSIIFFKMMTEAEEDKSKYAVLHKIGVSNADMKKTIRGQIGIIFAVPLALGLIHGGVALASVSNLLSMNFLVPVIIWMAAYTLIYGIYYFATVRSFNKTIRREYMEG